jgi:hypothetical protein
VDERQARNEAVAGPDAGYHDVGYSISVHVADGSTHGLLGAAPTRLQTQALRRPKRPITVAKEDIDPSPRGRSVNAAQRYQVELAVTVDVRSRGGTDAHTPREGRLHRLKRPITARQQDRNGYRARDSAVRRRHDVVAAVVVEVSDYGRDAAAGRDDGRQKAREQAIVEPFQKEGP